MPKFEFQTVLFDTIVITFKDGKFSFSVAGKTYNSIIDFFKAIITKIGK